MEQIINLKINGRDYGKEYNELYEKFSYNDKELFNGIDFNEK